MLSKKELLKDPNYLLSTYQLEIYRQILLYKKENDLTQKELANKLNVSDAYISQILNGNFNFTLKKLIELGLMMGKIPHIEFIDEKEYWKNKKLPSNFKVNTSLKDRHAEQPLFQKKLVG
jgi:transcriptional regulator with XRE-family HTH domain